MKLIITLHDKDIFPKEMLVQEPTVYSENGKERVKGIILDKENRLALVGNSGYRLLPGGGVDDGETLEQAMKREAKEEIGCLITVGKEIGYSDEYRTKRGVHHVIHCFVGKVIGEKGIPETTQQDEIGLEVGWYYLNDAISLIEQQIKEVAYDKYNTQFNLRAHLAFLKEYQAHE